MANISKAYLTKTVANETEMSAKDTKVIIDSLLEQVTTHLAQGNKVQLTGFGVFEVRERSARQGVKPGTTEKIQIPASKYPAFKAGTALKDNLK